ncbi:MAG: hypothetical protein Q4F41_04985 [Eubacteriales bacterium]|nr:hypothetical protein [Eubacteriales bacterium]
MGIRFEKERYQELGEIYEKWWQRKLERPLVKVMVRDAYRPEREKPNVPLPSQANCHLVQYSAEEVIDRIDYELSQCAFLGDAFPMVNFWSFGPGVLAGFCGAELDNRTGSVWFRTKPQEISEIQIRYDPENPWAMRIKELYRAGWERWQGQVVLGMPDLGGFQDVIVNFVGSQEMLYALYDEEEELHRLQGEVYQAWMEAYEDLSGVLKGKNPGFSDWGGLYSKEPSYILQDDFAYMISPDMFRKFGYPEIEKACERLSHTIYHLDGVGNLNHLPLLLENPRLQAIQWVYGEGQPSAKNWMEVYDQIFQAGKGIEVIGDLEDFYTLYTKYGARLFYQCTIDGADGMAAKLMDEKDCIHSYRVFPKEKMSEVERLLEVVQGGKYAGKRI